MERYQELVDLVASLEKDAFKFLMKGNKSAGKRLRKGLQFVKEKSQEIRLDVLRINKAE